MGSTITVTLEFLPDPCPDCGGEVIAIRCPFCENVSPKTGVCSHSGCPNLGDTYCSTTCRDAFDVRAVIETPVPRFCCEDMGARRMPCDGCGMALCEKHTMWPGWDEYRGRYCGSICRDRDQ